MAKNNILSPLFFGLLLLVLVAFVSERGGGVRGQSCSDGGVPFGKKSVYSGLETCYRLCPGYCASLAAPTTGVKYNECYVTGFGNIHPTLSTYCQCCVA
ncbi:hypothetical protein MKX03_006383 [Papaver bracteatum]|nr:hypothetical protein MKX03_006383 [Papaver bracteatum]